MSGIAGIVHLDGKSVQPVRLGAMAEMQRHRGPDDEGYLLGSPGGHWAIFGGKDTPSEVFDQDLLYAPKHKFPRKTEESQGYTIGLASRRLSIIDLSPAEHQPLCNENGDVWIVFDGRIYNSQKLRTDLLGHGHHFVSGSDTEVVLHAYEEWGEDCVKRFNGMWAFAIWDSKKVELFCSRDRFGIKPFYYYFSGEKFVFGSEIKALLAVGTPREVAEVTTYLYLAFGMVDLGDHTFFSEIRCLAASNSLVLDLKFGRLKQEHYWTLESAESDLPTKADDTVEAFRELFFDAVKIRLVSNASGFLLSGGLDSSSIVCTAAKLAEETEHNSLNAQLKSFSARYKDPSVDESNYADSVIEATGANPYICWPSGEGLLENLDRILSFQDEPVGSTSIYAGWSVMSLLARERVKVVLDGQGADEQLAGYQFDLGAYLAYLLRSFHLTRLMQQITGLAGQHRGMKQLAKWFVYYTLPDRFRLRARELLGQSACAWLQEDYIQSIRRKARHRVQEQEVPFKDWFKRYRYKAIFTHPLPGLLRYGDRNAMAHSVEVRMPFLDHRIVEFLWALPPEMLVRKGVRKWILREAMTGVLPEEVRNRHWKLGFATPESTWFKGLMRELILGTLCRPELAAEKFLDRDKVCAEARVFCSGQGSVSSDKIWRWLNLELWMRILERELT